MLRRDDEIWFERGTVERAHYAMHWFDLTFKDVSLERRYTEYTRMITFWSARTSSLVLWGLFFVTVFCAAPLYVSNHRFTAWTTQCRFVVLLMNLLLFVTPLASFEYLANAKRCVFVRAGKWIGYVRRSSFHGPAKTTTTTIHSRRHGRRAHAPGTC